MPTKPKGTSTLTRYHLQQWLDLFVSTEEGLFCPTTTQQDPVKLKTGIQELITVGFPQLLFLLEVMESSLSAIFGLLAVEMVEPSDLPRMLSQRSPIRKPRINGPESRRNSTDFSDGEYHEYKVALQEVHRTLSGMCESLPHQVNGQNIEHFDLTSILREALRKGTDRVADRIDMVHYDANQREYSTKYDSNGMPVKYYDANTNNPNPGLVEFKTASKLSKDPLKSFLKNADIDNIIKQDLKDLVDLKKDLEDTFDHDTDIDQDNSNP
jgi:hypothetical protein